MLCIRFGNTTLLILGAVDECWGAAKGLGYGLYLVADHIGSLVYWFISSMVVGGFVGGDLQVRRCEVRSNLYTIQNHLYARLHIA